MFENNPKIESKAGLRSAVNDATVDLQSAANQAGRKARDIYNTASNEITHASDKFTNEIRSNPIRSSAIALGIGVVLGAIIRR
jgi:ElaB/YqjD/DUF883 family membrane-anchored ribosome-binding protein